MDRDYDKVGSLLTSQNIFQSAAEIHGLICGQVSSGVDFFDTDIIQHILGLDDMPDVIKELLQRFAREVREELGDANFTFQPLLPGDEEEVVVRAQALGLWCDGFNAGFAAGFSRGDESLGSETREVLTDFSRIAEIESGADATDTPEEDEEQDYMEVLEYVRMAATTVYLQNAPEETATPADTDNILH